jgi:hypothetical protein
MVSPHVYIVYGKSPPQNYSLSGLLAVKTSFKFTMVDSRITDSLHYPSIYYFR